MITFSNKTNNGNFVYTNEEQGFGINGSYSLNENISLISINFSFGNLNGDYNNSLNGWNNGNDTMSFNINCTDFTLLTKVMNVYDDIVDAIKANYVDA